MKIGGLQKVSLLDYPDEVSAVIFTQGCNLRCVYCHNPELVDPDQYSDTLPVEDILNYLKMRIGKLQVTITGGEPLIHKDIEELLLAIKDMGFKIKLDTNGFFFDRLSHILQQHLVDYVAMDIKSPLRTYTCVVGREVNTNLFKQSIELLLSNKVDYEFRTTVVPGIHTSADIRAIASLIKGARKYYIQPFRAQKSLDSTLSNQKEFGIEELQKMKDAAIEFVPNTYIRSVDQN